MRQILTSNTLLLFPTTKSLIQIYKWCVSSAFNHRVNHKGFISTAGLSISSLYALILDDLLTSSFKSDPSAFLHFYFCGTTRKADMAPASDPNKSWAETVVKELHYQQGMKTRVKEHNNIGLASWSILTGAENIGCTLRRRRKIKTTLVAAWAYSVL